MHAAHGCMASVLLQAARKEVDIRQMSAPEKSANGCPKVSGTKSPNLGFTIFGPTRSRVINARAWWEAQ